MSRPQKTGPSSSGFRRRCCRPSIWTARHPKRQIPEPEKAAAEPATAEPTPELAEVSAIEAVIAQAFPELQSDTEPAAETTAPDAETAPAAETPPPPSVQDAAPQPELAAAHCAGRRNRA